MMGIGLLGLGLIARRRKSLVLFSRHDLIIKGPGAKAGPFSISEPNKEAPKSKKSAPRGTLLKNCVGRAPFYALKELPHPQVDLTLGLLNLNPEPSSVST